MDPPAALIAFPTWRGAWKSLDRVPALLTEVDAVLRRRISGNQQIPRWSVSDDRQELALGTLALRVWAEGEQPRDPAARPNMIRRIHAILQPALSAAAWPRWPYLERAFFDASATGDLLFAALTLRTMCEEVQRLHALDLNAEQLALLAGSDTSGDCERLKLFLSVAWTSLGALPPDVILQGKDRPLKLIEAEMPRLEKARRALNSYVHPNYGSHIAALFPERASPALLLLEAVIAVYEAFFSLSWTEQPVRGRAVPTGIGALESWPRSVRRLQWRTLPEMQRTAGDPVLAHVIKCPALIEWLTKNRSDVTDMLRDPTAATLLEGLPQRAAGGATRDEALHYQMWEGATAVDVLHLASARRAEQLLADEFPSGAPATTDQVRWLRFNALSLQLAMLLDQLKAALFKTQLVRQIAQGNGLGVMLCVRSLIEHRALVVWLPQKIAASLDALAGSLQAANPLPQIAAEVEQPLVNFLIAQAKESNEERRSWVIDERGVVRTAWLNLSNVIEAAFPKNDRFRTLYAIASATMHARSGRGSDLLLSASNVRMQARRIGLLVLERLCDWDEEMDHLSAALVLSMRLEHAASFGGTASATTDLVAQQVFGHVERVLVAGADFEGEGTSDSPFRLGAHLEFYQGSYALLRQFGVNVGDCPRMPAESTAGYLCDRWRAPKRDYWFTIPSLGPTAA